MKQNYFPLLVVPLNYHHNTFGQKYLSYFRSDSGSKKIIEIFKRSFLVSASFFDSLKTKKCRDRLGYNIRLFTIGFAVIVADCLRINIPYLFGLNIFSHLWDNGIRNYFWFSSLIIIWGLSILGFYKKYLAHKT